MSESTEFDLIALATPYALHAMPESELTEIERRLAGAPAEVARAFAEEVREVRETMAVMSAGHRGRAAAATAGPGARRGQRPSGVPLRRKARPWRATVLAAAAVIAIGLGALGVGMAMRPASPTAVDRGADLRRAGRSHHIGRHTRRRHRDGGVLPREEHGRAGDEQRDTAEVGHRLPDVADRRHGSAVRGDDGRDGGRERRPPRCCPISATPMRWPSPSSRRAVRNSRPAAPFAELPLV